MWNEIRYIAAEYPWLYAAWGAVLLYWIGALGLLLYRLKRSRGAPPLREWPRRLTATLQEVLIQRSIWRSWRAGLMHLGLSVGGVLILIAFVWTHLVAPRGEEWQGTGTAHLLNDVGTVMVLAGLLLAAWRRYVRREVPASAADTALWALLLGTVLVSLVSNGLVVAIADPTWRRDALVSDAVGRLLACFSETTLRMVYGATWSVLHAAVLGIAVLLPLGKWRHALLAPVSHLTRTLTPLGRWSPLDVDGDGPYGAVHAQDLTAKQALDVQACTRCGRCTDVCPAMEAGRRLDPLRILQTLESTHNGSVLAEAVGEEALWDCTTCMACTEVCPVGISPLAHIVDMRRERVLEAAAFPSSLQTLFRGLERRGNPWNLSPDAMALGSEDLGLRVLGEGESCDVLLWVGCMGRFDPAVARTTRHLADILRSAGVDVAMLGSAEGCCGDAARRAGNEYLWRELARKTLNTLNKRSFRVIVSVCPHCVNTLANEYGDLGGQVKAVHATTYLADLLRENRLAFADRMAPEDGCMLTYHDPCYLGRGNGDYNSARELLAALPGVTLVELERHGRDARCCGGGGGHMWMDEPDKPDLTAPRVQEIEAAGAATCATACPYCTRMLGDGMAQRGSNVQIVDVVDLVAEALESAASIEVIHTEKGA